LSKQKGLQAHVQLRICLKSCRRPDRQLIIVFLWQLQSKQLHGLRPLMGRTIRIGTRGSQLALWQARWIHGALLHLDASVSVDLIIIKTKGDKILDVPLANVGGKGLFVKEIEEALLDGSIDVAVHSMKDMPAEIPAGLTIGAIPLRANPLDAFVSNAYDSLTALPRGARVGTSSLRRSAQLQHLRPDLDIQPLRGNLDTRLKKLDTTDLDAIILAAAGLERLGLGNRANAYLPETIMLPAVGQGALCVETRDRHEPISSLVAALDHADTHAAVTAERAFLCRLEGGCQVPIAAHAKIKGKQLQISGLVAEPDGSRVITSDTQGPSEQAESLGLNLAEMLIARGADDILERLQQHGD
jgi:hydroxymethylbilane synthase